MAGPQKSELREFLLAAERIVREAGALAAARGHRPTSPQVKSDGSPVTDVDLAIEDLIRSRLGAEFPQHGILGEERPHLRPDADFQWVIDPIDGTRSFSRGIPLFGTLLALRHAGRSLVGVMALPGLGLLYAGAEGLGVCRNGERIRLAAEQDPPPVAQEILAIGDRRQFVDRGRTAVFDDLMRSGLCVRTYGDCFGHALAIDGRVGAMVDFGLKIWDLAATELLIGEAGGLLVRLNADDGAGEEDARHDVVFGKPHVVQWVLDWLRRSSASSSKP